MFKIMKDGVSHRKNADSLILGHRRTNFQSNGRLAVGLSLIHILWRRGWDSNPRALSDKRFSRPPRYDPAFGIVVQLHIGGVSKWS